MKLIIPMAGRGSRFAQTGVSTPKPLIPVAGRPMVAWALDSVRAVPYSDLVFIALAEHEAEHQVSSVLRSIAGPDVHIVLLDNVTEGQLCTVLAARPWLETDEDILISSADTLVISDIGRHIADRPVQVRGIISAADMPGDRWSFARTNDQGRVLAVAEKVRISNHASTGLYYFASGRELLQVAGEMIAAGEKTRGEYYVIPVYQKYIERGWPITISVADEMWDLGTPTSKVKFEQEYGQGRLTKLRREHDLSSYQ
jgi:NDP-sugar pyrophosphorylase family protein